MARGRRSGRTGTSGTSAPAARTGVPDNIETVEFEELPEGTAAQAQGPTGAAGAGADTGRIDVMAEPEEVREPMMPPAAETQSPPRPRRGGFWPGLIGGLLGGAAVAGGGGWWAYERGPIKPALEQLDTAVASTRTAETGIATLGGKLDELGANVGSLGNELDTTKAALQQADGTLATLGQRLGGTEAALQQADGTIAALVPRISGAESATADLATKLDQADRTFRAASEQVITRLEAVNAKLVEVEQAQPADVVDKKTVGDIAAKQGSIEQAQQSIAAGLARLEQLVTQSLEAGNQQAAALRTVVDATRSRMDQISAEQRDLMALKETMAKQEEVDQQQAAALAETGNQVTGVRTDVEQKLADVTSRLTALDAARERGVGLAIAAQSLGTALETGQPFGPTIESMTQLGQGDPVVTGVVATLEPVAAEGVPTFGRLAQSLGEIEGGLEPTSTAPAEDWLTRTRENLGNLVNLHPVDSEDVPGQGAVRGAIQAMLLQDLGAALTSMKPLAEQGNEPAKAWVAQAEQRLEAAAAVETLRQHVKTMLAGQG
jgi:hypothetical protein